MGNLRVSELRGKHGRQYRELQSWLKIPQDQVFSTKEIYLAQRDKVEKIIGKDRKQIHTLDCMNRGDGW